MKLVEYLEAFDPASPVPPDETRTHNLRNILSQARENSTADTSETEKQQ